MYQSLNIESARPTVEKEQLGRRGKLILAIVSAIVIVGSACVVIATTNKAPKLGGVVESPRSNEKHEMIQFDSPAKKIDTRIHEDQTLNPVSCGGTYTGNLVANRQIRYRFTSPESGTITFDTCDAARPRDTWLYLYRGTVATSGTPIWNCDDCGSCEDFVQTQQSFNLGAGESLNGDPLVLRRSQSYTIRVGSFGGQTGSFTLRVRCAGASGRTSTTTSSPQTTTANNPQTTATNSGGGSTTSTTASGTTTTRATTTQQPQPTATRNPNCPNGRVRKPWSSMTTEERNLYLDGYLALRRNRVLVAIRAQHGDAPLAHGNAQFLPWHRYFIWEVEEQIRGLGPRFECFTLPYWDWTWGVDTNVRNIASLPMFTQGLGGNGVPSNNDCVATGRFSVSSGYRDSRGACLTRRLDTQNIFMSPSGTTMTEVILRNEPFAQFWDDLEAARHDLAHGEIDGHMGDVDAATDDPLFFMLHGMVDALWALRQDCIPNRVTEPDYPGGNAGRQTVMNFDVLRRHTWSRARTFPGGITVASVFDSPDSFIGVTYDFRALLARARAANVTMGACTWRGRIIRPDDSELPRNSYEDDKINAYRDCIKKPNMCAHTEELETCGAEHIGPNGQDLTLAQLLNKRGVLGNACATAARKRAYKIAKQLGGLEDMCEGKMDNTCDLC